MDSNRGYEVAVVGSGLAGLVCARHLHRQGIQTILVEKSRGLGGRMATRRRDRVCFDHGLPSITSSLAQPHSQILIEELLAQGIVQPELAGGVMGQSAQTIPQLAALSQGQPYIAPDGMTAIAKYLAQDLEIRRDWLLQTLIPANKKGYWQLENAQGDSLQAQAVVMTVPAPQALAILTRSGIEHFSEELCSQLSSIVYDPCLVVMVGYAPERSAERATELALPGDGFEYEQSAILNKIIIDSRKRPSPDYPVLVLHSTPDFARQFDAASDLSEAAQIMVQKAAEELHSGWAQPQWQQVHRWRHAIPQSPLATAFLAVEQPLPLYFCGDGYGASQDATLPSILPPTERAISSGFSGASDLIAS